MNKATRLLMAAFLAVSSPPVSSAASPSDASTGSGSMESVLTLPPAEVARRLPNEHPTAYYAYAGRMWAAGDRDRAVFWLYAGELRFRFLLLTEPNADPSGDSALFASLHESIGAPINLYAGADTSKWVSQINAALKWDADTPNGFTSKTTFRDQWMEARSGLEKMRDYVASHGDEIRREREQQGIGEIGVRDGVYVEERRPLMPLDWPALERKSTPATIAGVYKASSDVAEALFSENRRKVRRATTVHLESISPESLVMVARRDETELDRRAVAVRGDNGAVAYDEILSPEYVGLSSGNARISVYLRANTTGDLIVERELSAEGQRPNSAVPVRLVYRFWTRLLRANASP